MRKTVRLGEGCLESKEPTRYHQLQASTSPRESNPRGCIPPRARLKIPDPTLQKPPLPGPPGLPRGVPSRSPGVPAHPGPTQAHPDCSGWSPEDPGAPPRSKSGQCPRSPASHSVTHLVSTSRGPRGRLAPARSDPDRPRPRPRRAQRCPPRVRIRLGRVPIQIQAGIQTWRSAL